jgi:CheY-like chemotaxis protein
MFELKTILIAEDNPLDIELTVEALSEYSMEHSLITVRDGVEAIEYLTCEGQFKERTSPNPSVVLLDIKMPRMDGIEVLESIRKNETLKTLPVVILTSSREEPDIKKCYDLGANAYVVKPVNFKDFIEAVGHIGFFWARLNEQPFN